MKDRQPTNARASSDTGARALDTMGRVPRDIEDLLVWTYRAQRADVVEGRGAGLYDVEAEAACAFAGGRAIQRQGRSGDGVSAVERLATLGCRVNSAGWDNGALDPDAETIHLAVMRLSQDRHLPLLYGRRGLRPELTIVRLAPVWKEAGPRYLPGTDLPLPGAFKVELGREGYLAKKPVLCHLTLDPPPSFIQAERDEYERWHNGLTALADYFKAAQIARRPLLKSYWVTGPQAPERPWESDDDPTWRVASCASGVDLPQPS